MSTFLNGNQLEIGCHMFSANDLYTFKEKLKERLNVVCHAVVLRWLQLPDLIRLAVVKQQPHSNTQPFHREVKLFRCFRKHVKSNLSKLSTKHSTKKHFISVFCLFSQTWFCELIYTFLGSQVYMYLFSFYAQKVPVTLHQFS